MQLIVIVIGYRDGLIRFTSRAPSSRVRTQWCLVWYFLAIFIVLLPDTASILPRHCFGLYDGLNDIIVYWDYLGLLLLIIGVLSYLFGESRYNVEVWVSVPVSGIFSGQSVITSSTAASRITSTSAWWDVWTTSTTRTTIRTTVWRVKALLIMVFERLVDIQGIIKDIAFEHFWVTVGLYNHISIAKVIMHTGLSC